MAYLFLKIPSGKVAANLTDFVVYVDLANLPDFFWQHVSDNGGDVRVKTSGESPLPTDLVWLDKATKTGALFFRSSLLSASENTFRIEFATGLTALDVHDTYGRNAVWQDYKCVTLLGVDPRDRSGHYTIQVNGDPALFEIVATHTLSEDPHQGVAWDGTHWYLFHTDAIYKYDSEFNLVSSNTAILTESGLSGVNHICDGTYHAGYLYTVLETYPSGPYANQHLLKISAADLSIVDITDISAQAHECSSVCYCDRDGYLYITDYTSDAQIYKYTTGGEYIGTLSLSFSGSELEIQGIEWFNDAFWVTSDANDEVYRVEYDGTVITHGLFGTTVTAGYLEGICRKNDRLVVLEDPTSANSYLREWRPLQIAKSGGGGYDQASGTSQYLEIESITSLTTFTLAATAIFDLKEANRAVASYHHNASGVTNNRVTVGFSNTNSSVGVWDNNNSWLLPSPAVNPTAGVAYRLHAVYNGTTSRRIYVDGALQNTQAAISAIPSNLDHLLLGIEDDSIAEQFDGKIGFAYLRESVLSDAWIAAEYANLNNPSSFYTLTAL
jgi:hypothetical protein